MQAMSWFVASEFSTRPDNSHLLVTSVLVQDLQACLDGSMLDGICGVNDCDLVCNQYNRH